MAHDVFISYSHDDKAVADAVCARLEQCGTRCWYAPRDVPYGGDWASSIISAIESAKIMVLVFSDSANASKHVVREVSKAVSSGAVIIPFKITTSTPSGAMEYYLETVQWLDACGTPLPTGIESLHGVVRSILGAPAGSQQAGASPSMLRCPRCAGPVAPDHSFCVGCGLPIDQVRAGQGGSRGASAMQVTPGSVPQAGVQQAGASHITSGAGTAGAPSALTAGILSTVCFFCFFPLGIYDFVCFYKMLRAIEFDDYATASQKYKAIKMTALIGIALFLLSLIYLFYSTYGG